MALIILCTHIPVQVGVWRSENTSGRGGIPLNSENRFGEALEEVRGEDQDRNLPARSFFLESRFETALRSLFLELLGHLEHLIFDFVHGSCQSACH